MKPDIQTPAPSHEIITVQASQDRELCYCVRIEVFHHEQKFPLDTEIDEYEDIATHFLLRLTPSLDPVGTIRVQALDAQHYKLSRLAVLKEYRRFNFGKELVDALHDWVRAAATQASQTGSVQIITHSQIPVKGFYARLDFTFWGDEFDEDGAPHQKMILYLHLDNN
ncbi:hypothetical protein AMATHDRAFT_142813 [Amanita thiersii Skay4041]|uniref:N-acetyltransferase domain-containing protein n=1 Tax=Amanita thiersii Skay4041 TaxID=703135 RepID=A0A2A9NU55_9AGAR|nr:hypothetical protein AMATHDRAFT_142813 [Amanita thiersii Skay4041]